MAEIPAFICTPKPLKLPVGVGTFSELVREGHTFVDKTLMIREVVNTGAKVTLITRPRRFGKTLNLSMLQHFFAAEVAGQPTQDLFENLAIAQHPDILAHQGQYPVIFLTLKDCKQENFDDFIQAYRKTVSELCMGYLELPESSHLLEQQKRNLQALISEETNLSHLGGALKFLSQLLYQHHKQRVYIFIDEYDTPIHTAYDYGYYNELIKFMRGVLGPALKDNPYLHRALMTGVLRVAKEGLFSDLNNLNVATLVDREYSQYFGFTEAEVNRLLPESGVLTKPDDIAAAKDWYNGYRYGDQIIYNPWSIIRCLHTRGELRPHWVNTSGNVLLRKLLAEAGADFKQEMETLLRQGSSTQLIDPYLVFSDLGRSGMTLWGLLLFSGYLSPLSVRYDGLQLQCELAIPNREIAYLFENIVRTWFTDPMGEKSYRRFLDCLVTGNLEEFRLRLEDYLLESASAFDPGQRHPEKFYHGLVLGLIASLRSTHAIYSNRESGYGRYDVAVLPKRGSAMPSGEIPPGILMEFKQVSDTDDLDAAAGKALAQIDRRRYQTELDQHGVKNGFLIGMAFSGKQMKMAYKSYPE